MSLKNPRFIMYLPYRLFYKSYEKCLGAVREDFFVEMLRMKGWQFSYLKTKKGGQKRLIS